MKYIIHVPFIPCDQRLLPVVVTFEENGRNYSISREATGLVAREWRRRDVLEVLRFDLGNIPPQSVEAAAELVSAVCRTLADLFPSAVFDHIPRINKPD